MQLPKLISRSDNLSHNHRFLACHIEESFVTVAVWGIEDDHTEILAAAHPKEWQDSASLSDAVEMGLEELQAAADNVQQVLFGLPSEWVENDDITDEYKEVLKGITQKLSLTPIGFVVTQEALFQHLSRQTGAAAQMLVIEFTTADLTVSLIERGNRKQVEQFGRSEDLPADLIEGFARLKEKPYPPQIFFYSTSLPTEKLEEEKQTFMSYDWKSEELFTHLPQVDVLDREVLLQAICLTGGLEVVKAMGLLGAVAPATSAPATKEAETPPLPTTPVEAPVDEEEPEYAIELDDEEVEAKPKRTFAIPFFKKGAKPKAGSSKNRRLKIIGGAVAGLLLLFFGVYAAIRMQTTVTANVILEKEAIFKDIEITLDPTAETDPEENILQASVTKKEVSDSEETSTTGTKEIGEKATGTVTILNKTESEKSFSAGTEITADNKKFVLDDDVTVASSSAKENADGKTLEFGKADVKVTAAEIGAEYNLGKDTEFSVANYGKDTYAARATGDFSGGSSREIQAVAQADRQKLLKSLRESLVKKAEEQLQAEAEEGEYIILTGKSSITDQEFDAEVGDETNTLQLTMSVQVEAYVYKVEDLTPIAQAQLSSQIPDGGSLIEESINIMSKEKDGESSTASAKIVLDAKLSADYAPKSQEDVWRSDIAGKGLDEANRILEQKSEIKSVSFSFAPGIARMIVGQIPGNTEKIIITTALE